MFKRLTEKLSDSLKKITTTRLTDENIQAALADVRRALLEADVAVSVVQSLIDSVLEKAIGHATTKKVRAKDAFIKIVQDEITEILGKEKAELNLKASPPIVILMAGLQGSGKTTTAAKLARYLKLRKDKSVMLASVDVYRPAALDQLETLAKQIDVPYFPCDPKQKPIKIAKAALSQAKQQAKDILILDTAGRMHVDDTLMQELKDLHKVTQPTETLLVVDSMTGQDAANVGKQFSKDLDITGIILTKVDGDTRGGAALSMRMITEKSIKFVGVGEKIDALESFHPERVAARILGMGDIVSLVEEVQHKVDKKKADKLAKKIQKGTRFDFNDFLGQLQQMKKMGGLAGLLAKLPMGGAMPKGGLPGMMDDEKLKNMEAIVQSMTLKERLFPALINGSRKRRISMGSGTTLQDVSRLLKQFSQMEKMFKRAKGTKMKKRMNHMQNLQNMSSQLPPELLKGLPKDLL